MLPRHLNLPFTMMPSLVHKASHSSMLQTTARNNLWSTNKIEQEKVNARTEVCHLCDVSTTERPVLMMSRIKFQRNLRAFGSIPVVGSSWKTHKKQLRNLQLDSLWCLLAFYHVPQKKSKINVHLRITPVYYIDGHILLCVQHSDTSLKEVKLGG